MLRKGVFLLIISLLGANIYAAPADEKAKGDAAYSQNDYATALSAYESAYGGNYVTETMLFRMAFIYEQRGQFAYSIFCLKKAQFMFGSDFLTPKIQQLIERLNGTTRIPPTYPPLFHVWTAMAYPWALGGMAVLLALLVGVSWRRPHLYKRWGAGLAFGLCAIGGVLLVHEHTLPRKAVVVAATPCYEAPSYALLKEQDPVLPGLTLDIADDQDIWFMTGAGRYSYWIPKKNAKEL